MLPAAPRGASPFSPRKPHGRRALGVGVVWLAFLAACHGAGRDDRPLLADKPANASLSIDGGDDASKAQATVGRGTDPRCSDCPAATACVVEIGGSGGGDTQCVPIPASCMGAPTCACMADVACTHGVGGRSELCFDLNGLLTCDNGIRGGV